MVKLIAQTPCAGLLPRTVGACTLSEVEPGSVTSVMPAPGQEIAVAAALKERFGLGFPKPNRTISKAEARIIWFGPGQAMLIGPALARLGGASLCDQSDGFALMRLSGAGAVDVLARLVPVDLRDTTFKRGHTARTLLGHLPLSVTRVGVDSFDIIVFRSMAGSAVHEFGRAMGHVLATTSELTS